MQKGKTWQRVASAVLAVMMTMSTFSSTIAYAAEPITADSSLVTDAVSESTSTEAVERKLWGRSRFFNDETQKNRKRHALRG